VRISEEDFPEDQKTRNIHARDHRLRSAPRARARINRCRRRDLSQARAPMPSDRPIREQGVRAPA